MKKRAIVSAVFVAALAAIPSTVFASPSSGTPVYRLYNRYSGEHFYTTSENEVIALVDCGWNHEGIGWVAPEDSDTPVYRLYNPNTSDHHYTTSSVERDTLIEGGWADEGTAWYSDDDATAAIYREYNPNATTGTHNYTGSLNEHKSVVGLGWSDEGVAFYALEVRGMSANVSQASASSSTHKIMGASLVSAQKMAAYFNANGYTFPSSTYASRGASSIEEFCSIVFEEAEGEGVRAEVLFCQMMWETGWLKFGGDVLPDQCNFGGLGATGGGVRGNSFPDVRTGVRAQVQHLKAYASTEPLNNACVDSRFSYVTRGIAPEIEGLSGTWAVDSSYGTSIYNEVQKLLAY